MAGAPHLESFLAAAKYFIGVTENPAGSDRFTSTKGKEMVRLAGFGSGFAWCAMFISACAQKAGIAGKVIEKQTGAGWIQQSTVLHCGGTWIDGPYINGGNAVTPIPGDIISFSFQKKYSGHGHASHVGIVEYVEGNRVHTIEGNTGNACKRKSYALNNSTINCYVRPDWSRVGDDISSYLIGTGSTFTPLYQNRNDRHDMTMRQVGYLDGNYKLSNNVSGIAISIINYTTTLGDLYDMFAPMQSVEIKVDTSKLTGNTKIAMDYFIKMGCTASAAAGLTGCLQAYSVINPNYQVFRQNATLYGIGAWDILKLVEIKQQLGDTWNTNLSGQLVFFLYDIENTLPNIVGHLKTQSLDVDSAYRVATEFMTIYNKHCNSGNYVMLAQNNAKEIFGKLIITKTTIIGSSTKLRNKKGELLSAKRCIEISSSVPQTGIIDDYTSYSAFYTRWQKGTVQRTLANTWKEQGYPCSKGIATIGGYYCVAVRPKFGTTGDVIVVSLSGNVSFPAIICDIKADDAKSEWGHVYGSKISVIEWERVKTKDGKVVTGTGFTDVDKRGFSDWYGKKVLNITNYGKYL